MIALHRGDCLDVLPSLAGGSVEAVVTDPPYGLGFMGKRWDAPENVAFRPETWAAMLPCLAPGGYLAAFGGTRTSHRMAVAIEDAGFEIRDTLMWVYGSGFPKAKSCLKPAWEPIILARRPGPMRALNIDGCRVSTDAPRPSRERRKDASLDQSRNVYGTGINGSRAVDDTTLGRWPANLVHDGSDEVLAEFARFGERGSFLPGGKVFSSGKTGTGNVYGARSPHTTAGYGDTGTAARFFYCAKATKADRGEGNAHPTVKPTALMRWLVRLLTPHGGTVLDPFTGSGSTGKAATLEGFGFVGIEREAEYFRTAKRRIAAAERAALSDAA